MWWYYNVWQFFSLSIHFSSFNYVFLQIQSGTKTKEYLEQLDKALEVCICCFFLHLLIVLNVCSFVFCSFTLSLINKYRITIDTMIWNLDISIDISHRCLVSELANISSLWAVLAHRISNIATVSVGLYRQYRQWT